MQAGGGQRVRHVEDGRAGELLLPQLGHSGISSSACSATWKPHVSQRNDPAPQESLLDVVGQKNYSSRLPARSLPGRIPAASVPPPEREENLSGLVMFCTTNKPENHSNWTKDRIYRGFSPHMVALSRHFSRPSDQRPSGRHGLRASAVCSDLSYPRAGVNSRAGAPCIESPPMRPLSVSRTIDVPRERVFDYLSDIANHSAFVDHYLQDFRLERLDSRGVGAAASYKIAFPSARPGGTA